MIRKHVQLCNFFVLKWIYSQKLDPKARAQTENIETVVIGIYYQTNIYTTDLRH